VPNQTFSTTAIVNHSARPIRRITLNLGLTYDTGPEQMRGILRAIRELVASHEDIDQGFHFVHFTDYGASSLDLQIYCFTKSTVWVEYLAAREDLMLKIMDIVEEHGSSIAFPSRTVYLHDQDAAPQLPAPAEA
jgi:MscS family membrane protein